MTTTMKMNYFLFCVFLFVMTSFINPLKAQTGPPLNLGSTIDYLDDFRNKIIKTGKDSNTVTIKVSSTQSLTVKLNVKKKLGNIDVFSGHVLNESNSSFSLTGTSTALIGRILLKDKKEAYKYYSDNTGNAYVVKEDIDKVVCIDFKKQNTAKGNVQQVAAVHDLQSLPGAEAVVMLDFDGQYVVSPFWNNGNPIDAQPSGMDDATILEIWEMMSEDFRPYVLNITTDEAVYQAAPANRRMRCIFTPTDDAWPGSGGVAYIGSFTWGNETPCWVFNGGVKGGGEAGSHEIGHTVGLGHDGRTTPQEEYFAGHGNWAPIMGVGYYRGIVQWSSGEYANANNPQDDINIIGTTNGFGFRSDDHGNTHATATMLTQDVNENVSSTGVIEQRTDVDVFSFQTTGGTINLTFSPAVRHPNLDISVTLRNSSNVVIATSNPVEVAPAVLNMNVAAGTYYISLEGVGSGDPVTNGYSDYGSLGLFSVSGSIPNDDVTLRNPENPANTVNGLEYKYFQGNWSVIPDFAIMTPIKTGTVTNFDLSPRLQNDNFGFRFSGYVDVPVDGVYTFYTSSDDGSKLYIGSMPVVVNDGLHGIVEKSGTIGLKAGKHSITVDYFDASFDEFLSVSYAGPGIVKTLIPNMSLYRVAPPLRNPDNPANTVNGLDYKYFQGNWSVIPDFAIMTPIKTGTVTNFDLSPRLQNDNFGFRFSGYVDVPVDGVYTFYTSSDDGSKLYIGSMPVVVNDGLHGIIEKSGTIGLKAGKHSITVDYFEATGGEFLSASYAGPGIVKTLIPNMSLYRVAPPLRDPENPANTVNGLDYKYFQGNWSTLPDFGSMTPIKTGTVTNFDLSPRNQNDNFGFRFTGYVDVPTDGIYTFYTSSDDGSKLYIGSTLIVNNDGLHAVVEKSGTIGLKAGKHAVTVDYFDASYDEFLSVSYAGPGIGKTAIPSMSLYRVAPGLRDPENPANTVNGLDYKYFHGNWSTLPDFGTLTPIKTGTVANFDLSPRTQNDNYGFRYTGYVNVPTDGIYTFYTSSDDGSKLYIGSTLIVNNDGLHGPVEQSGVIGLKAGKHAVTIDYFEATGGDLLTVSYAGPGISKTAIPSMSLYRVAPPLRDPENPANTVNGLDYKYFQGNWSVLPDFGSMTPIKTGTVANFDLSPRTQNDYYGFRYTGYVNVPADGMYTFYTFSDDGSKFYIGSTLIVNNDGLHAATEKSGTIGLKAGKHSITADFFEAAFGEVMNVSYSNGSIAKQLIPNSALFRVPGGSDKHARLSANADDVSGSEGVRSIYPNPAAEKATINYFSESKQVLNIQVTDLAGRNVLSMQQAVEVGLNDVSLQLGTINQGVYLVHIIHANAKIVQKIIVNK